MNRRYPPEMQDFVRQMASDRVSTSEMARRCNEKLMYDLMDTRELLIGIESVATDSERINSLLASITRLQQFFTAHGHDCVELANLKEPKVLPFDPQGYLS